MNGFTGRWTDRDGIKGEAAQQEQAELAEAERQKLKRFAKEALDIQNACNPGGVLRSWVEAHSFLCNSSMSKGTDWVRQHPIMVAYADKLASLCGVQYLGSDSPVYEAFRQLEDMSK